MSKYNIDNGKTAKLDLKKSNIMKNTIKLKT